MKTKSGFFRAGRPLLLFVAVLCACAPLADRDQGDKGAALLADALRGRSFVLSELDGAPFKTALRPAELTFGEDLRLSGALCNRFSGQAELQGGLLRAEQLLSTRMLCLDAGLSALEADFLRLLRQGAELSLQGEQLTLRGAGRSFVYRPRKTPG